MPTLKALQQHHDVVAVFTQPDRPAGRGRTLSASPVKQFAQAAGRPVWQPESLREPLALQGACVQLAAIRAEVLIVVAYGLLLPPTLLAVPRFGGINIHASLLPRWRGAAPIARAIEAEDAETGISIMQMDAGLDTGAVFCMERLPITAQMTAASLHDELAECGARLLLETLQQLALGKAQAVSQPASGATYAKKLSKSEARIDWQQPASRIDARIRAFNPWPLAETTHRGEPLKLLMSRVANAAPLRVDAPPGTLLRLNADALEVACGQGVLQVLQVQRAGKRPITAVEFANGEQFSTLTTPLRWE